MKKDEITTLIFSPEPWATSRIGYLRYIAELARVLGVVKVKRRHIRGVTWDSGARACFQHCSLRPRFGGGRVKDISNRSGLGRSGRADSRIIPTNFHNPLSPLLIIVEKYNKFAFHQENTRKTNWLVSSWNSHFLCFKKIPVGMVALIFHNYWGHLVKKLLLFVHSLYQMGESFETAIKETSASLVRWEERWPGTWSCGWTWKWVVH